MTHDGGHLRNPKCTDCLNRLLFSHTDGYPTGSWLGSSHWTQRFSQLKFWQRWVVMFKEKSLKVKKYVYSSKIFNPTSGSYKNNTYMNYHKGQHSIFNKSTDQLGGICNPLNFETWTNDLNPHCLNFLNCKTRIMMVSN